MKSSTVRASSIFDLLSLQSHIKEPLATWLESASSSKDVHRLLTTVKGLPLAWLEWADKHIRQKEKSGVTIVARPAYALTTIENGIVNLQESKFLCDLVENALRAEFIHFVSQNMLLYAEIYPTVHLGKIRNIEKKITDFTSIISPYFILETEFEQLRRTYLLNWSTISRADGGESQIQGFGKIFWNSIACRDKNLFASDMSFIRQHRNIVAHSKRPISTDELLALAKRVVRWLEPLGVHLSQKIVLYRRNRPRFLFDLQSRSRI